MNRHETKNCPRCNATFECKPGSITQCQCYGIELTAEQKTFLEQHYSDCLCRNCLLQLQDEFELFKEKVIHK